MKFDHIRDVIIKQQAKKANDVRFWPIFSYLCINRKNQKYGDVKSILNNKLTHGNKAVNFVTSYRADQGDCRMHVPIKVQMNELIQNPPASAPCEVTALSKRRWMIESEAGPIVQLELFDDDVTGFVYATTARDGSGPLRASFITMLLLEDSIATAMRPYGVCSGDATVTVYRKLDLREATPDAIYREMMDFAQLAASLLAKRGIGLPDVMPFDDRDMA
jgi:hypothetical protein